MRGRGATVVWHSSSRSSNSISISGTFLCSAAATVSLLALDASTSLTAAMSALDSRWAPCAATCSRGGSSRRRRHDGQVCAARRQEKEEARAAPHLCPQIRDVCLEAVERGAAAAAAGHGRRWWQGQRQLLALLLLQRRKRRERRADGLARLIRGARGCDDPSLGLGAEPRKLHSCGSGVLALHVKLCAQCA